jgi:hypothetical protein
MNLTIWYLPSSIGGDRPPSAFSQPLNQSHICWLSVQTMVLATYAGVAPLSLRHMHLSDESAVEKGNCPRRFTSIYRPAPTSGPGSGLGPVLDVQLCIVSVGARDNTLPLHDLYRLVGSSSVLDRHYFAVLAGV